MGRLPAGRSEDPSNIIEPARAGTGRRLTEIVRAGGAYAGTDVGTYLSSSMNCVDILPP